LLMLVPLRCTVALVPPRCSSTNETSNDLCASFGVNPDIINLVRLYKREI
jgi:hypothetical protein